MSRVPQDVVDAAKIADLKASIRDNLLTGRLILPDQFLNLVGFKHQEQMNAMFHSLFFNYIKNKGKVSIPYWYDRFNDDRAFNTFLKHLSKSGWVTTKVEPNRNWAEMWLNEAKLLQFVTRDELINIRKSFKLEKYKLNKKTSIGSAETTKIGKEKIKTGIKRPGFAKAGQTKFQYDIPAILRHQNVIEQNLTKSMDKLALDYDLFIDGADYSSVSKAVLQYHIDNPDLIFTTGNNLNDSRGRAISSALGKVFNPIGNKDARSLLVIPEEDAIPMQPKALTSIYLFISELLGYKPSTVQKKKNMGFKAYNKRTFNKLRCEPHFDGLSIEECKEEILRAEDDRADLHENIWLERIYNELDHYHSRPPEDDFYWSVPIEIDATASMLQFEGALLGHEPFLRRTNCIGKTLEDIWTFEGIPRKQFKAGTTPMLYGSSATVVELWKNKKIKYTREQVKAYNEEIMFGDLNVSVAFKDFIINNVKPKEEMNPTIWGETFSIKCNRWRNKGDYVVRYNAYDTKTSRVQSIYHTHTHKEPDLKQFRRYFVTLLIHNLDSQVADYICQRQHWIIPIHDAFLVDPNDAHSVAEDYAGQITAIYRDRKSILSEYFKSIGIDSKSATAWKEVKSKIKPVAEDFQCLATALK